MILINLERVVFDSKFKIYDLRFKGSSIFGKAMQNL
jgi:hypothetical protein